MYPWASIDKSDLHHKSMESLPRPQQHPGEGTHGVRDRLRKGLQGCTGRKHHRDWSKTMCGRVGSKSPRSTLGCQKHTADTAVEQKVICCLELAHRVLSMHFLRTQRKEMHARGEEEKPQQASHCMSERQDHQSSHGTACHSHCCNVVPPACFHARTFYHECWQRILCRQVGRR